MFVYTSLVHTIDRIMAAYHMGPFWCERYVSNRITTLGGSLGYLGYVEVVTRVFSPLFSWVICPQILGLQTYSNNQLHPVSWTSKYMGGFNLCLYPPGKLTYPPHVWHIWVDDVPFPQVGYVHFLEGILTLGKSSDLTHIFSDRLKLKSSPVKIGIVGKLADFLLGIHMCSRASC